VVLALLKSGIPSGAPVGIISSKDLSANTDKGSVNRLIDEPGV
jgi:hypothetical protein